MKRRSAPKNEQDGENDEKKCVAESEPSKNDAIQFKELRKYDNSFSQYDVNVEERNGKCMRCGKTISKGDLAFFFYTGEKGSKAHLDCFFPWYVK